MRKLPSLKDAKININFKLPAQIEELKKIFSRSKVVKISLNAGAPSRLLGEQVWPLVFGQKPDAQGMNLLVKVDAYKKVVKTKQYLKRFSIISEDALSLEVANLAELPGDVFFDLKEVVGQEAVFGLPQDRAITSSMVRFIPDIRRDALVNLLVKSGNILLKTQVIALTDGYLKKKILVMNPKTKRRFEAAVLNKEWVELKI